MKKQLSALALASAIGLAAPAVMANTGGGAVIHNAATLTYGAGIQVTAAIDVTVETVGAQPTLTVNSTTPSANGGDQLTLTYTITNESNGTDQFNMQPTESAATGVLGSTVFNPNPIPAVQLGASITNQLSVSVDADTGTIFIPAGSGTALQVSDTVEIAGSLYTVEAVRPGTAASTTGNTTTAEVATEIDLTVANGTSVVIGAATVGAGIQVGEQSTFTVIATLPTAAVAGTPGSVTIGITGTTTNPDPATGSPITITPGPGGTSTVTVLSATVTLLKQVVDGGTPVVGAVTAKSGDTVIYRITAANTDPANPANSARLMDPLPAYTSYVPNSTTLDGVAVADDATGTAYPLDNGIDVYDTGTGAPAVSGSGGTIAVGQSVVVEYSVTID